MFTLSIETGNDAMQSGADVAETLRTIADRLESGDTDGKVRDLNGNTVGEWELTRDERRKKWIE